MSAVKVIIQIGDKKFECTKVEGGKSKNFVKYQPKNSTDVAGFSTIYVPIKAKKTDKHS